MRRRLTPKAGFSIDSRERANWGIAWWLCSPIPPCSTPLRIISRKSSQPPYNFNTFNSTLEDGFGLRLGAKGLHFATRGFCLSTLRAMGGVAMPSHGTNASGTPLASCIGRNLMIYAGARSSKALQLAQMVDEPGCVDDVVAASFDHIGGVAIRIWQAESGRTRDMITGVNP